ncbi:MAG: hypothetical protein SGARI_008241, partial [Bacillariaceae sp.]
YQGLRRRLGAERHTGEKTFFLIRITTQDEENFELPVSATDISNVVWGADGRQFNMQNQFNDCSADKLNFKPAEGFGIVDGVMEITLDHAVNNANPGSYGNIIYEAAADILGADPTEVFDYTGICYPDAFNFWASGLGTFRMEYHHCVSFTSGTISSPSSIFVLAATTLGQIGGTKTLYGKYACTR